MTNAQIRRIYKQSRKEGNPAVWWDFLTGIDHDPALRAQSREVALCYARAEDRVSKYKRSFAYRTRPRAFCNLHYPSDAYPYEVLRVVSPRIVEIREMSVLLLNGKDLIFNPGGFFAHCPNQHMQKWAYFRCSDNPVRRIHLGKYGWGKGQYQMSDTPYRFYDYNL